MSKTKIAFATILLAAGAGTTALVHANRAKDAEIQALRNSLAELQTKALAPVPPSIDPAELARLHADQREAIKLRGDLALLRQALSNADAQAVRDAALAAEAATAKALAENSAKENYTPEFRVFSSKATANIPPGQSLLLGGWHTGTNTATYAFLTPTASAGSDSVSVTAKLVEVDRAIAAFELATLQTNSEGNLLLDPAHASELFEKWKGIPGVNVLSVPTITVASGRQGRISVTEERSTPNGPVTVGPELDLLPTLSDDGSQIHVKVEATLVTLVK